MLLLQQHKRREAWLAHFLRGQIAKRKTLKHKIVL